MPRLTQKSVFTNQISDMVTELENALALASRLLEGEEISGLDKVDLFCAISSAKSWGKVWSEQSNIKTEV